MLLNNRTSIVSRYRDSAVLSLGTNVYWNALRDRFPVRNPGYPYWLYRPLFRFISHSYSVGYYFMQRSRSEKKHGDNLHFLKSWCIILIRWKNGDRIQSHIYKLPAGLIIKQLILFLTTPLSFRLASHTSVFR